ncbi:MAG: hypothetical protein K5705_13815 [Oscillospiraceae bacterium]|nr:hypothetical protein [Oscillospiraceae bacterium]
MILIFSTAVFVTALLAVFVFHSAVLPSLIIAAAAAATGIGEFLIFRRKPKLRVFGILACFVTAGAAALIPARAAAFGSEDYGRLYADYASLIERGKYDKAAAARQTLEEKYGMNDDIRFLEGVAAVARKDVNKAEEYANGFSDKSSLSYFSLCAETIKLRYPDINDCRKALRELYENAVKYHQTWSEAQKQLGILMFYDKEYDAARYHLITAAENKDEQDGEILYYMGASFVEQGDNEKGLALLSEAYAYETDETVKNAIVWYADQAGLEGES